MLFNPIPLCPKPSVFLTLSSDFNCMALSNSGVLLAAATVDCIVTVWDLANNADGAWACFQQLIHIEMRSNKTILLRDIESTCPN